VAPKRWTSLWLSVVGASLVIVALAAGEDGPDEKLRTLLTRAGVTALEPGPPADPAKALLGKLLFFDRELSGNRDVSCATCHNPRFHTSDGLSLSIGVGGTGLGPERILGAGRQHIPRNATDLFNRGLGDWRTMFWDARLFLDGGFVSPAGAELPDGLETALAAQAMFPVTSRDEMRGLVGDYDVRGEVNELALIDDDHSARIWDALLRRLLTIPEYVELFRAAYPETATDELGFHHAANAIAAFEVDAWTFLDSPWDHYLRGDGSALGGPAKRGATLFYGRAGCASCHAGSLMTDQKHHNIGVPQLGPGKGVNAPLDLGRFYLSGDEADRFAFRTPPLRNVNLTGPWMHNGAYTRLEDAVRHHLSPERALRGYDAHQLDAALRRTLWQGEAVQSMILATLDPLVAEPRALTDAEFADLMAFLGALTDPAALDLSQDIPDRVPSGLPVD
jgi:cytochrome c peroxidase